jgi:hypothetical protein
MQKHSTGHVEPLRIWQCASGHSGLSKRDYQHIMSCAECETLGREIDDALKDLERKVSCPPGLYSSSWLERLRDSS